MTQNLLIFAGLLIVAFNTRSAFSSGTCSSIGYSASCCPPSEGDNCKAADGDCYCNAYCHVMGDCCRDVYCPAQPRTCADVGITQCCDDPNGTGQCDVYFRDLDNNRCSCDVSCHKRNDCCQDAPTFCRPCNDAGKYPNCCYSNRKNASACFVPEKDCYCDPLCKFYGDCCNDAARNSTQCLSDYSNSSSLSRSRLQSWNTNDKIFSRQRFYNRERHHRQRSNTNHVYQEAPADRVQQTSNDVIQNQREFRSRRRMTG